MLHTTRITKPPRERFRSREKNNGFKRRKQTGNPTLQKKKPRKLGFGWVYRTPTK